MTKNSFIAEVTFKQFEIIGFISGTSNVILNKKTPSMELALRSSTK